MLLLLWRIETQALLTRIFYVRRRDVKTMEFRTRRTPTLSFICVRASLTLSLSHSSRPLYEFYIIRWYDALFETEMDDVAE